MNNSLHFILYTIFTKDRCVLLHTSEHDKVLDYLMDHNMSPYQIVDVDLAVGLDCSYFVYSLYSHSNLLDYAIKVKQEELKYDTELFNRICNPAQMLRNIGVNI